MDQVKVILQHVKKHLFWLVCLVCVILGFVGWSMASGKLSAEYQQRKSAIDQKFSALDGITSTPNFPNPRWKEGIDKVTGEQKARVDEAWKLVYNEQAKLLQWPDYLGASFPTRFSRTPEGTLELPARECEMYMNTIEREFPKLLAIIGAEPHDKGGPVTPASRTTRDEDPMSVVPEDRVKWDESNQQAIQKALRFGSRPSALQVMLTQEDLWMYRVLLSIIANVNAGRYVPAVKEIDKLLIARPAAAEFAKGMTGNQISKPAVASGEAPVDAGGAPASEPPMEGQEPAPDEGRYVDDTGSPLSGQAAATEPFKRMPVYMELVIDQREISKLLAECANSPLPVEVRQLRINPSHGTDAAAPTQANAAQGTGQPTADRGNYDVPIEISGIIYIYNPPPEAPPSGDASAAEAGGGAIPPSGVPGG